MADRFPCLSSSCDHWNTVGRETCFACKQDLRGVNPKKARRSARRGLNPLALLVVLAVAVGGSALGWHLLSQRAAMADEVPPVLVVDDPATTEVVTNGDTLHITGAVQDEHPSVVEAGSVTAPIKDGRFTLDVTVPAAGGEIRVTARDVKGNESTPVVLTVTVDREAPTVADIQPADGATVVTRDAVIVGTASEPLGGVTVAGAPGTVEGASFRGPVALQPGANTVAVTLTDRAGNRTELVIGLTQQERRLPAGFAAAGRTGGGQEIFTAAKDGARLVLVPAGSFSMGQDQGGDSDERPAHEVSIRSFFLDLTPVTNAQYAKFVAATGSRPPPAPNWDAAYLTNAPDSPVVNVTWPDARDYAEWAGRRLPTEAEWEYAARGTRGTIHGWGDDAATPAQANLEGDADGHAATSPVGAFPAGASPFGVLDLIGNVWEWTADRYAADWYSRSPAENPEGPERGSGRVLKGGSFVSGAGDARPANRYAKPESTRLSNGGFRTAVDFPTE